MSPPRTIGPRRPLRRAALVIASLVLGAAALEGGHRLWRAARGRTYSADGARASLLRARDAVQSFVPRIEDLIPADIPTRRADQCSIHPFYAFDYTNGVQQIDDDLEHSNTRPPGEELFEVLIVGGSVAEVFGQQGTDRLAEILQADPRLKGRNAYFFRFGRGGFKQPQQINLVVFLLGLGFQPEAVLLIDGFNEVALGNNNAVLGESPVFPSFPHWTHLALAGTTDRAMLDEISAARSAQKAIESGCDFALRWRLYQSSVLGKIALGWIQRQRRACDAAFERYTQLLVAQASTPALRGPRYGKSTTEGLGQSIRCWAESSRMLAAICRGRSIPYLHVLQPTLRYAGSKAPTAEEERTGGLDPKWLEGVVAGYPMLRSAGAQLAREGLPFLDLTMLFKDRTDTIYADACHFGKDGNVMLAERVGAALLEAIPAER